MNNGNSNLFFSPTTPIPNNLIEGRNEKKDNIWEFLTNKTTYIYG